MNPHLLLHFIKSNGHLIHTYGYVLVFLFIMLEDFGIPSPGEITLIAASLIASQGQLNIILVLFIAWVGAVTGDNIGFAIGHFGGERLFVRYGKVFGLTQKHFDGLKKFFNRYGGVFVLIARFFEGARQLNGIISGSAGMRWLYFLIYNLIGAALWVGVWGFGAYMLGSRLFKYIPVIKNFTYYLLAAIFIFILVFILLSLLNVRDLLAKRRKR